MSYTVKETYATHQGEGFHTGRAAVFLRFTGCNLWTGRDEDRSTAACSFCDTDFVGTDGPGGGRFTDARSLAAHVLELWQKAVSALFAGPFQATNPEPFVVCTGGEPLLQLDPALIEALHQAGFMIAVETNGTIQAPAGLDWICVSPKAETLLEMQSGDELKLVYPQVGAPPELFESLEFSHHYLQPMDGPELEHNTAAAMRYCLNHPNWKLSLQTHKLLGIP